MTDIARYNTVEMITGISSFTKMENVFFYPMVSGLKKNVRQHLSYGYKENQNEKDVTSKVHGYMGADDYARKLRKR
jgi:hypothetical protein